MSARPNNSQEHACSIDIACVIGCSVKRYPAKLDFVTMMLDDRSGQEQVVDNALVRMYFIVCSCDSEQSCMPCAGMCVIPTRLIISQEIDNACV